MDKKTYFFQPEKKALKQGYFLTDEEQNIVYEAKMLKQPILGPMVFDFINHISGAAATHKVGQTITTESGGGLLSAFSTKSYFKYDGQKIWDYLHENGIRIDSKLSGQSIGMRYHVTLRGNDLADIASASVTGAKALITSGNHYHVTAAPEDLDLAFLVTFAIARTDQAFYH